MSDPTAELPDLDARPDAAPEPASDLDAAIAAAQAEGDVDAAPPSDDALRAFTAMQYALLEEVRRLLDETNAHSRDILEAIFDPASLRSSETELERVIGALAEAEPETPAAPSAPPDARPATSLDATLGSLEELEAALLAAQETPSGESETANPNPNPNPEPEPEPEPAESPSDAEPDAAPSPERTQLASLPMRLLDRAAAPLRTLAAPLRSLPPSYRPIVGVFALTLFLWYPAVRWIAGEAATASRVRPLTAVELDELSAALRPPSGGSEEKGAKGKGDEDETKAKK